MEGDQDEYGSRKAEEDGAGDHQLPQPAAGINDCYEDQEHESKGESVKRPLHDQSAQRRHPADTLAAVDHQRS